MNSLDFVLLAMATISHEIQTRQISYWFANLHKKIDMTKREVEISKMKAYRILAGGQYQVTLPNPLLR